MKKFLLFLMFALFCVPWAANAQDTLTVHDENTTTNSYVPVWGLWADNSLQCEIVYPASELEEMAGGVISALKFYTNSTSTNIGNASASSNWDGTFTIFMKEVEATTLSDFTGTTGATTVLEAQIGVVNGEMTIEFTNPYTYGGGNLLVGIYYATGGHYCSVTWVGNSVTGASIYGRSGQSYSATQGNFIPKTTFIYTPGEAACAKPESIEVSEVTAYSANVAWEGGSGTYQLQLKAPTDEDWEDVMYGSYTSFSFDELTPATTYEVRVRSLCGEDPETGEPVVSFWKSTSFTTPCAIITSYPWTTNFDDVAGSTSGTTNNLPMCWNYINSSTYSSYKGYPIVYSASATAYSGNNYLRFYSYAYYNTSGTTTYDPQDQYAILPEMEGLDGKQISFFARGHNASSTFKVGLMTDPADASTFTAIATQALTTSYEEYTYDIQGEGNYIAIMIEAANPSRTTNGVYIDDIKVADPPACPKPQSFVVVDSSVTAHTATLSWASDASAWQISLVNGEEEEIFDVEENPYTFTGLAPETTFTVKVRANCGTIVSEWSVEKNFTTAIACPAPTGLAASGITSHEATLDWTGTSESYNVMYRTAAYTDGLGESFGTSLPSGWENKSGLLSTIMNGGTFGTTTHWSFGSSNGVFDQHARINIYGTTKNGWLITPEITVNEGFNFSFDLALTAFSGTVGAPATTGTDDKFVVLVTTDNEASWTILRQWDNAGSEYVYNDIANSAAGENVNINIDQYIGMNVRFAFYGESTTSNADNNLHIDNVSCGIYHEAGDWQSFVVNEAPAQLTDLEGGTAYNAKLQGDCGVEGLSVETSAITFSTLPACSAPAELTCTGVTTTTATFTWTTGDYPECQVEVTNNGVSEYYTANETPYTVEGLNPGTTYTVRVRPLCDTSLWSSTVTVITGFVVPLVEPFNTTSIPVGWSRYVGLLSGVMAGTTTLSPVTSIWTFGAGSNGVFDSHAYINIYGTSRDHWLVTPLVLMEDNVELSFDLALTKYSGTLQPITDTLGQDDKFVVLITNDNGASWQVLRQWDNTGSEYVYNNIACSATGEYVTIDLSSYAGQNVAIAFYGESTVTETGSDNNLHIDNVSINYIPTCPKPVDLSAEDITYNSATLSWSVSGLENDGWNLAYKKVSDTVFTYVEGVAHPYVLGGLAPATTYEFYVIANCGQGGMSESSIAYTFTTECGVITSFPWSENFDAYTGTTSGATNNLPICWNYINTSTYSSYKGYPVVYNSSGNASSTPNSLRFYSYAYYNTSGTTTYDPQDQYAILPEMEDLEGKIITMNVKGSNVNSTFYVGLMTDPTDASTFVPFATQAPTTSYEEYEFTIEGEGHYIAIKMDAANQSQTTHGIYVDDIAITFPPACPKPTNVTVYNIQPHIVTVGCESTYATEWEVRFDNDTIIYTNEMPYTLEDPILTAGATHTVEVHAYCGDEGAWSEWSNPISFTTACEAVTEFPWTDDFEEYSTGNFTAVCWQNEHIEGTGTQIFKIMAGSSYSTGDNTSHVLQLPDMAAGTMTKLVLPYMTLPSDNYQFTLDVYRSSNTYQSNPYELEGIRVFASTNGEIEGATELAFIPRHYQVSNDVIGAEDSVGWYTYELPIGISGNCYIILRGESQYCTSTYMDNFVVEEMPVTTVTQTTALSSGANWFSSYVEITLDDLKAALAATGNTEITIQGQTQNTIYNPNNGRWTGQLRTLDLSKMYIIKVADACEITLEGM
nr:fibronectin type III domain-containing protein [Bacteroidales bacterium]